MQRLHAVSGVRLWITCAAGTACAPPPSSSNQPTIAPNIEAIRDEVFRESCIFTECHDQNRMAGGLVLGTTSLQGGGFHASPTSPEEIAVACENLLNQPIENSSQLVSEPDAKRVSPGDPEASFLLRKLENRGLIGGDKNCPMPWCCGDDCEAYDPGKVAAIRLWISDGAADCVP